MAKVERDIPGENVATLVKLMQEARETYTGDSEMHVTYGVDGRGKLYGFRPSETNLAGVRVVFDHSNMKEKRPEALRFVEAMDFFGNTCLSIEAVRVLTETIGRYNSTRT